MGITEVILFFVVVGAIVATNVGIFLYRKRLNDKKEDDSTTK